MSIRTYIAAIALAFLEVSGAGAQTGEVSSRDVTSEIFDLLQYETMIGDAAAVVADQLLFQIRASVPDFDAETETAVRDLILKFYLKMKPEMERVLSEFMTKHFTESELREILAFHKSDVGMKWAKLTPVMAQEIVPLVQQLASSRIPQLLEEIEALVMGTQ